MAISITIPTNPDPDHGAYCWGRNGHRIIQGVHIMDVADHIWMIGMTRRGEAIEKSGFRLLPDEMDRLATEWLVTNGLLDVDEARKMLKKAALARKWIGKSVKLIGGHFAYRTGRVENAEYNYDEPTLWVKLDSDEPGEHRVSVWEEFCEVVP
jgi:hypothetical protein